MARQPCREASMAGRDLGALVDLYRYPLADLEAPAGRALIESCRTEFEAKGVLVLADFLRPGAPFAVHGTFHGMAFAPGPWFLLEAAWADRTGEMRRRLRRRVGAMGYRPFDIDRGGEKGFARIDEGFSTRPDSAAMRDYFLAREDPETAGRFRPSSMELVRSLGGDPLTFVSENPLFLLPADGGGGIKERLTEELAKGDSAVARLARDLGVRPMAIRDQMQLQLAFLNEALSAVATAIA